MAKTIKLDGDQGQRAFLGLWIATIHEGVKVSAADRRRHARLQDALEDIAHRQGVGPEETVQLKEGTEELHLEEGEFEYLGHRLRAIQEWPPQFVKHSLAAEDAVEEAKAATEENQTE